MARCEVSLSPLLAPPTACTLNLERANLPAQTRGPVKLEILSHARYPTPENKMREGVWGGGTGREETLELPEVPNANQRPKLQQQWASYEIYIGKCHSDNIRSP